MSPEEINKLKNLLSQKQEELNENVRRQTELRKESDRIWNELFEIRSNLAVAQRKLEKCKEGL